MVKFASSDEPAREKLYRTFYRRTKVLLERHDDVVMHLEKRVAALEKRIETLESAIGKAWTDKYAKSS